MSSVQSLIKMQAQEYAKIVVPEMTRGVPLKDYTEISYDFTVNHSNIKPVSQIGPLPTATRVQQKNNNIVYN